MKMRSCAHWNYGYYGKKKGCMLNKTCQCEDYERRATARKNNTKAKRRIEALKAKIKKKSVVIRVKTGPVPKAKSTFIGTSKLCANCIIEKIDKVTLKYCTRTAGITLLPRGCPKGCKYRESPGRQ